MSLRNMMDIKTYGSAPDRKQPPVSLKCPFCQNQGTFDGIPGLRDFPQSGGGGLSYDFGLRRCPNLDCGRIAFVVREMSGSDELGVGHYPPQTLAFDSSGLPDKVRDTLDEAVRCFGAGCFNASAVMLRRAVEEMCDDLAVPDGNLVARIPQLGAKISANAVIVDGLHKIRIFGNQGGHTSAERYERVDAETVTLALKVVSRLIQAAYQDQDVVSELDTYLKRQADQETPSS